MRPGRFLIAAVMAVIAVIVDVVRRTVVHRTRGVRDGTHAPGSRGLRWHCFDTGRRFSLSADASARWSTDSRLDARLPCASQYLMP